MWCPAGAANLLAQESFVFFLLFAQRNWGTLESEGKVDHVSLGEQGRAHLGLPSTLGTKSDQRSQMDLPWCGRRHMCYCVHGREAGGGAGDWHP